MTNNDTKSLDILGVKPVADAISSVTKGAIDGASAFLSRICLPAAEEFGLLLQDRVRGWRAKNTINIISTAQVRYNKYQLEPNAHAHPRLVAATLEHGSWSDDQTIQEMWGGLLASSCTADGRDESNLIFISLLSQLTSLQVRILNYACEKAEKEVSSSGLITSRPSLKIDSNSLIEVAGTDDIHRIDQEMDHLRGLELIYEGFNPDVPNIADISPSSLALNLYVKCQGFNRPAIEFFKLSKETTCSGERVEQSQ